MTKCKNTFCQNMHSRVNNVMKIHLRLLTKKSCKCASSLSGYFDVTKKLLHCISWSGSPSAFRSERTCKPYLYRTFKSLNASCWVARTSSAGSPEDGASANWLKSSELQPFLQQRPERQHFKNTSPQRPSVQAQYCYVTDMQVFTTLISACKGISCVL